MENDYIKQTEKLFLDLEKSRSRSFPSAFLFNLSFKNLSEKEFWVDCFFFKSSLVYSEKLKTLGKYIEDHPRIKDIISTWFVESNKSELRMIDFYNIKTCCEKLENLNNKHKKRISNAL